MSLIIRKVPWDLAETFPGLEFYDTVAHNKGFNGLVSFYSFWFVCVCAFAQQQLQVENAASLLTGDIAAGSLVKLQLIIQGGPITPIDPASVSAQLLPMGFQNPLSLAVLQVLDATSALVLIPSDTPLGPASITLSYNSQSTTQNVNIVATSFGLYSVGSGEAALAQNVTGGGLQLNNLTHPAHPLDFLTLWGTGLGSATADQVTVLLGGHPFPVAYAGPSGDYAGLDQINFQVPDDPAIPQGCYVAVNIQIGNSTSNLGTLSLSQDAGPCAHPFGLTADELAALDAGGQVYVGQINLYSSIGPPARPSLSPANSYVRMESGNAQFLSYDAPSLSLISQPLFADDYLAGCTLTGGVSARLLGLMAPLNVGDQVNVRGPGGQLTLTGLPFYSASLPATPPVNSPDKLPAPFFTAGQWQASASGNSNAQPFTAMLTIPNPMQITNYGQVAMADHTKDLTIDWDPTTYSDTDFVNVQLYSQVPFEWFAATAVLCRVPASAGQATIPAPLLALYQPAATATLSLSISRKPRTAGLFTVGLTDGTSIPSAFQSYSAELVLVQFF